MKSHFKYWINMTKKKDPSELKVSLLSKIYVDIEKRFGLTEEFTHWDFEHLLGKDKSKERNKIAGRFLYLAKMGILYKIGEEKKENRKKYGIYKATTFPISVVNGKEPYILAQHLQPKIDLDLIAFNLGRKPEDRINFRTAI